MLYERLIRPLLFRMDAEQAHEHAVRDLELLGRVPGGPAVLSALLGRPEPGLETKAFGLTFPNPLGLAAGFDKDCRLSGVLPALGFGFLELGSVTLRPQPGNPKPRIMRLPLERALINRMGFPSSGAQEAARRLQAADRCAVPVGINIGLNADCPKAKAPEEYAGTLRLLHPCGDYFVVNVSCPNMTGLRDLQERLQLERILIALAAVNSPRKPVLVKLAPDLADAQLPDLLGLIMRHADGVVATNTTTSRQSLSPELGDIQGGLSGRPLRSAATAMIAKIYRLTDGRLPIIGVGGVETADDVLEKLRAGASLVQLYTGLVYGGPGAVVRILKDLRVLLSAGGFQSVAAAVGSCGIGSSVKEAV
ncbi:MAG: quinone-dependent dihydroorotate dehydrogenase [Elusimicrobia bacterium]|nr:quinone-dependent dihydroorotate dehydrogenase [Elusimicrobiota bacterium]